MSDEMRWLASHLTKTRTIAAATVTWRQGTVTDDVLDADSTIGVTVRGHDPVDGTPTDSAPFRVKTFAAVTNGNAVWLVYLGQGAWLCLGSTLT